MSKVEIKGREFTKCDAFWECGEKESFTGVLIDINERFPDAIKGKGAVKPLYIFKSLGAKDEKPSLSLDEKKIANRKGLIVGVFDSGELNQKLFAKYDELLGHEITLTYEKKEEFKNKDGASQSIKRMKVLAETDVNKEFAADVRPRAASSAPHHGSAPAQGDTGPYVVE